LIRVLAIFWCGKRQGWHFANFLLDVILKNVAAYFRATFEQQTWAAIMATVEGATIQQRNLVVGSAIANLRCHGSVPVNSF
jgi:hypothetical protein